jgi:hypothetical protein
MHLQFINNLATNDPKNILRRHVGREQALKRPEHPLMRKLPMFPCNSCINFAKLCECGRLEDVRFRDLSPRKRDISRHLDKHCTPPYGNHGNVAVVIVCASVLPWSQT